MIDVFPCRVARTALCLVPLRAGVMQYHVAYITACGVFTGKSAASLCHHRRCETEEKGTRGTTNAASSIEPPKPVVDARRWCRASGFQHGSAGWQPALRPVAGMLRHDADGHRCGLSASRVRHHREHPRSVASSASRCLSGLSCSHHCSNHDGASAAETAGSDFAGASVGRAPACSVRQRSCHMRTRDPVRQQSSRAASHC